MSLAPAASTLRSAVAAAGVVLVVGGCGGSAAPTVDAAAPAVAGKIAVVVESRGTQAVAVLSRSGTRWRVVKRIPVRRGIRSIAWRPIDGTLAVSTGGGNLSNELRVIDVARGTQRTLASARGSAPAAFFGSLAWSPDGRRIAVTRSMSLYGADIAIVDVSTRSLTRSYRVSARHDSGLAWTADGKAVYFAEQTTSRREPTLRLLTLTTGAVRSLQGIRGLDPARGSGALWFSSAEGVAALENGRVRRLKASRKGDRFPAWLSAHGAVVVERPATGCPRFATPPCSRVVLLRQPGTATPLLRGFARNPATR